MSDTPGLFEELKRRNVVRVGVVYLITAWLLAQVADLMLENFQAPDWVIQAILVVLIIGFPIALIFAWAFELTPEGLKKEKDVDRTQSITHTTGRKLDRSIIAVLVVALAYFVWEARYADEPEPETEASVASLPAEGADGVAAPEASGSGAEPPLPPPAAASKDRSVAVLPFVNMSSDPEQEFFSDGISEEILNALAKVKELKVAGRTSSFAFKGQNQDLRQIGEALGVENILEGSVRKAGTTIRITAQLIQVEDGFHLWSETYDRELTDVFAIQDEIATAILEQLKTALIGDASAPAVIAAARTDSAVYDQYLLARQRLYDRKRFSIESAVELLDKAIARDPDYAPAWAQRGIAAQLLSATSYGETAATEADIESKRFLDQALKLDSGLAEGWAGMGLYHTNRPGEYAEAIEALEKALAINPNLIDASNWLQIAYGSTGDNARALQILEGMIQRDPLYPPGIANAVQLYNYFGLQDKSWALLEKIGSFIPDDPQLMNAQGQTWISLGQPSKALPLLQKAVEQQPSDAVLRAFLSVALLRTGQYEQAAAAGSPWLAVRALSYLDRPEEALATARKLAGEGDPGPLIVVLAQTGQLRQVVELVESRWPDLAAFERENPHDGRGHAVMLAIARAYAATSNEARFNDAMARVRTAHDHSWSQGAKDQFLLAHDARYYLLAGDPEQAVSLLARAVDQGLLLGVKFARAWPEMESLSGDPEFEAVQAQMLEHLDNERAELGLEPLSV